MAERDQGGTALCERFAVADVDSHIIEPADLWTSRLSAAKWGDKIPHVKFHERRQEDYWYVGDQKLYGVAAFAQARWPEYPPSHPPSLAEVDRVLAVAAGDRVCLVGRNGSGKSTLLRIAAGLVQPDAGYRFAQPGATIHYLPQEPDLSGFTNTLTYVEAGFSAEAADGRHRHEIRRRDRTVGNPDREFGLDGEHEAGHVERREADVAQIILQREFTVDGAVAQQPMDDVGNLGFRFEGRTKQHGQ